jgi:Acyl-CoA reductase (LuxC)/Acyl-protein synthetase, LuxE
MISWCIENFGAGPSLCCADPRQVEPQAAYEFLRSAQAAAQPVCILGTTAALSTLFEYLRTRDARLGLAPGSRLMDTGGPKGQARPLEPHELIAMATRYLAIAPGLAINEYGMTELCSQLYDATPFNCPGVSAEDGRVKIAPPWLAVMARDPATMRPLAAGQSGLLSFFDLANAGSVSALFTEDLGSVDSDGSVRILGRALAADPRGCALSIERFAQPEEADSVAAATPRAREEAVAIAPPAAGSHIIEAAASRLRGEAGRTLGGQRIAGAIAEACALWRNPGCAGRRTVLAATAAATGQSEALLDASLDALLAGFTHGALTDLGGRLAAHDRLIGLIMPGNVIGAGLHELSQALIGGAAVIVKAASAEPLFFAAFQRTLSSIDAAVAARMCVLAWSRTDRESTAAMARVCDRIAAFGDDETMAALAAIAGPRLVDFGSRLSGALISKEAAFGPDAQAVAGALARDVTLFDQRGCLSLHHVFVEASPPCDANSFARSLARAMADLTARWPAVPATPADGVGVRVARENARWRAIGGTSAELWEGDDMGWTVIFDPDADFHAAPLCRTVAVSAFANEDELQCRLAPAAGKVEGFAIADPAGRLRRARAMLHGMGVSYFCQPGLLQSPPPSWPHGGGRFLELMVPGDD